MTAAAVKPRIEMKPEVDLTRIYHAPKSLVWKAWTDPVALKEWYGPHFFTNASATVDLRVGGQLRIVMQGPDGAQYPMTSTFREIKPEDRLVMHNRVFEDDKGAAQLEVLLTVTFSEDRGRTIVHVQEDVLKAASWVARGAAERMREGMVQSLERLGGHLGSLVLDIPPETPTTILTRVFKAPRALVWEAMTKAEHLKHWWGQNNATNIVCEIDARPGGTWRVHQRFDGDESIGGLPKGTVFKFHGEILEVVPPEKLVQTFRVEGMYDGKAITEAMTLIDLGNGRTLVKIVGSADTIEERDGLVASGMSYGAQETYDRLDAYLATMGG